MMKASANLVSSEGSLLDLWMMVFLCSGGKRERMFFPIRSGLHPYDLICPYFPRGSISKYSSIGELGLQHVNFGVIQAFCP